MVAVEKLRGHAHVALGVDGVVVAPVGNRRHGNPGAEAVGVGHGIERETCRPSSIPTSPGAWGPVADTWPAPHPPRSTGLQAARGQSCDRPPAQRRGRGRPCRDCRRAARQIHAAPAVRRRAARRPSGWPPTARRARRRGSRSAARWPVSGSPILCIGRQQQRGVERGAVVRLHLKLLRRAQVVGSSAWVCQKTVHLLRGLAKPQRGRIEPRRVLVDKPAALGSEVAVMESSAGAQLPALAVEAHLPYLLLQRLPSFEA